jgi:hypothetical protein
MTSPPRKRALLLSRDLFFASKVTGTAAELGLPMDLAGSVAESPAPLNEYDCVLIDLGLADLRVRDVTAAFAEGNRPRVIAFGAHVDTARLDEARAAECDEVLPRSRFSATLPDILRRCCGQSQR